jgi:hypothetical protein
MSVAKGRLNWGVFFIVLGAVPLAYHQGAITSSAITDAWRLWPLIIVGIGVGFILSRTPAYFVGGLIVAATMGLIFGSLFAVGPNVGCGHGGGNVTSVSQSGSFDGPSSVQLNLQCGSANVTASSDGQWHVNASNDAGHNADISSSSNGVTVKTNTSGDSWFNKGTDTWQIALPGSSQLDLTTQMDLGEATFNLSGSNLSSATFNMNLGSLHVDLTGSHIDHLTVSTSLGAAAIELDGTSDVTGDLKTSLGSLKLCAPSELGLQIKSNNSLGSENLSALGMNKVGDVWQTPNYQTASHRATLTVETSLGSLELHAAGGCK